MIIYVFASRIMSLLLINNYIIDIYFSIVILLCKHTRIFCKHKNISFIIHKNQLNNIFKFK